MYPWPTLYALPLSRRPGVFVPTMVARLFYVDVKRAASYLSVAVKTLNEWARLEKIPAYPWGDGRRKTWRFKLSELDEWMQRRINSVRRPPLSERTVRREKEAH
jgi:excisionase family DNA binding protein